MTRLWLSLAVLAFFLLCLAAMWWGWRNRQRRQAAYLPALPALPAGLTDGSLLPPLTGVYVGSTTAGNWQDRIAAAGLGYRAAARVLLHAEGLLIDRTGADPVWIPLAVLRDARTERALAGKVMGTQGLLVFRWQLGEHLLDSGVRADDKDSYGEWIAAVRGLVGTTARPAAGHEGDDA